MRTYILIFKFIFLSLSIFGQTETTRKSFDHLSVYKIFNYDEATFIVDSLTSVIYNSNFSDLKQNIFDFKIDDFDCDDSKQSVILAGVLLDKKSKRRALLTFEVCPEYQFNLYDLSTKKIICSFYSLGIVVSSDGALYTFGHLGEFNLRQKFKFSGDSIVEEKQPYYYVGLLSKTINEIRIYSDKELTKEIAVLPNNCEIEVLLAEKPFDNKIYLVRTSFGLVGWAELKVEQYKSVDVEGLFYNDD